MMNYGEWNSTALRLCVVVKVIDNLLLQMFFGATEGHLRFILGEMLEMSSRRLFSDRKSSFSVSRSFQYPGASERK